VDPVTTAHAATAGKTADPVNHANHANLANLKFKNPSTNSKELFRPKAW
jgi:hypothetical protein